MESEAEDKCINARIVASNSLVVKDAPSRK